MADNVLITPGTGTPIATDDVAGVQYQRIKVAWGVDGSAADTTHDNPFPVVVPGDEYETVAASATAQVLGATGATGDYLLSVLVIPATTSPGAIALLDGATSMTIFTGGASSVSNLVPFTIPFGIKSVSGAWKLTTGANVSCIGIGNFT